MLRSGSRANIADGWCCSHWRSTQTTPGYTEVCAHIHMAWRTNRTDGALIPRRRIDNTIPRWVDETGSLAASPLQRVLRVIFDRGVYVPVHTHVHRYIYTNIECNPKKYCCNRMQRKKYCCNIETSYSFHHVLSQKCLHNFRYTQTDKQIDARAPTQTDTGTQTTACKRPV